MRASDFLQKWCPGRVDTFCWDGETIDLPLERHDIKSLPHVVGAGSADVWLPRGKSPSDFKNLHITLAPNFQNATFVFGAIPVVAQKFYISGFSHKILSLTKRNCSINVKMGRPAELFIGENVHIGEAEIVIGNSEVSIGAGSLISREVLFQGSDQHGIIDRASGEILNRDRGCIRIDKHVWLGRRVALLKRASVGRGAIVAMSAIVAGNIPEFTAVGGVPARVIRENVTWCNSPSGLGELESEVVEMTELPEALIGHGVQKTEILIEG